MFATKTVPSTVDVPRQDEPERRRKAAALVQSWLDDPSDHDEKFWPVLEKELRDSRLRCRD